MQLIRKITVAVLLCFFLFFKITNAQQGSTSITAFLQQNADTTIAISKPSNWGTQHEILYLSKKGDTINLYRYGEIFNYKIKMPKKIKDSVYLLTKGWEIEKLGVNRFFTVVNISLKDIVNIWRKVNHQKPWQIADDSTDGKNCPNSQYFDIYDGGKITLDLITKNNIKKLSFYAPQYYEKLCPGRRGRRAILKIEKLFNKYFKE